MTSSDPFLGKMCLREIQVLRWSLLNPCGQSGGNVSSEVPIITRTHVNAHSVSYPHTFYCLLKMFKGGTGREGDGRERFLLTLEENQ